MSSSRQLHSIEETIKQSLGELKLKEEKLNQKEDDIKQRCEELERREKELELTGESQTSQKEINRIQDFLKELELAKLGFEEELRKLDLQEKKLLLMAQERFEHQARLQEKEREFEAKEKRFKEFVKQCGFSENFKKLEIPFTRSKSKILQRCSLIQNLTEKDFRLQAIKLICEFDMADKFSLPTLLQDHLRQVKKTFRERKHGDESVPTQIVAITKEIADLKAVIKLIQLYNLGAYFPLGKIEKSIRKREKKKVEMQNFGPRTRSKSKLLHQPSEENSDAISIEKETQPQECRNKRARMG
ncbi:meiosis-specific nuclear structural protein 1-like [Durio zibethinus]|uniref:FRIGIDA-like protein n=1 Tax=Durio zibethinus TaxID=66656 RepID=A0A6P5WV88_DURZI|nr:meiosis-specific nuclear structural protein 1-like [Durio zibethinus]